ncbi:MAG: lactate utilization protein [Chloroflexi bacterium]|nr:lactate utilization protein [Chloroflexota bacterium]
MTERGAFLDKVAGILGKPRGRAVDPDAATHLAEGIEEARLAAEKVRRTAHDEAASLMDGLAQGAAQLGWVVHRTVSHEDAADAVLEICRRAAVRTALRADMPVFGRVPVDRTLQAAGIDISTAARPAGDTYTDDARRRIRAAAFAVDVGITGVEYAVAETGTAVLHPRQGLSRLVSLAPPRHVAIVERGQALPSLDELFLLEREAFLSGTLTSSFNLISGPSKTGDIAATIVQGVHGPVEVHMVLVG